MKTYSEKLRHPKWQEKRLQILKRDEFCCQLCSDKETELHVHHFRYKKGNNPWEYHDDELVTYCKNCHFITEKYKNMVVFEIKYINNHYLVHIVSYDEKMNDVSYLYILKSNNYGIIEELCKLKFDELNYNFFNILNLIF